MNAPNESSGHEEISLDPDEDEDLDAAWGKLVVPTATDRLLADSLLDDGT